MIPESMPDTMGYDAAKRRLLVGRGYVGGVSPKVWNYEVSGKQVLRQWFSYRKSNRERPGDWYETPTLKTQRNSA